MADAPATNSAPASEKPKDDKKYHIIPAGRTDDGKEKKVEIKEAGEQTLADALANQQPDTLKVTEYKSVDFGDAGKLTIEAFIRGHYGLTEAEYDVTVRVSDEQTFVLRAVPERFLKD